MSKTKEKNLALAIGLNIVLPGLGYMYMGKVLVGLAAMLIVVGVFMAASIFALGTTWLVMNAIMAIDMFILQGKNKETVAQATLRKCPQCAEMVQKEAKLCRFCGAKFE